MLNVSRTTWIALSLASLLIAGCTPVQYARQADVAAYEVVAEKQQIALGGPHDFTIDYDPLQRGQVVEAPAIAFRNSRSYQDRKEQLYLAALALSESRHRWSLLGGDLSGRVARTVQEGESYEWSATGDLGVSTAGR
jgi:hypothetical protein